MSSAEDAWKTLKRNTMEDYLYPLAPEHVHVTNDMLSTFSAGAFSTDSWHCAQAHSKSSQ